MANLAKKQNFDWKKVFDELELHLKSGQSKQVRDELRKYPSESIPHEWVGRFASLARRSGIPGIAVKNLHALLRLPTGKLAGGFEKEKAEYAASLIEIGVMSEAEDIIDQLNAEEELELFLWKVRVLFSQRNYRPVLSPLEKLVRQHRHDKNGAIYQAKMDLAFALIQERVFDQADALADDLIEEFIQPEHAVWRGRALLIAAQSALHRNLLGTAQRHIYSAQAVLKGKGPYHEFYARQWLVIHNLLESGAAEPERTELKKVRVMAKELGIWEAVRDCDHFEAKITGNIEQHMHVYFGSPFPYYQKRLISELGKEVKIPEYYYFNFDSTHKAEEMLDVTTGQVTRDIGDANVQSLPISFAGHAPAQKLLQTLASDFYAPFSYGALWDSLFPHAAFHPKDSLLRVKGMVAELENWFMEHQVRIEIKSERNAFSLASSHPISLKIHRP